MCPGRTEVCDNLFGGGKQYAEFKDGNRIYNSGDAPLPAPPPPPSSASRREKNRPCNKMQNVHRMNSQLVY